MNSFVDLGRWAFTTLVLFSVLLLGHSGSGFNALCQDVRPIAPQKWGLIVAVDNVKKPGASQAALGEKMALLLKSQYGYSSPQLIELYNENATYESIAKTFYQLNQKIKYFDSFFAYIAMPVVQGPKELSLSTSNPEDAGIPYSQIEKMLSSLPTRVSFVLLEGCLKSYSGRTPYSREQMAVQYTRKLPFQLLSFCGKDESGDKLGEYFCRALDGQAADLSGKITIHELVAYLRGQFPPLYETLYLSNEFEEGAFSFLAEMTGLNPDLVRHITDAKNAASYRGKAVDELLLSYSRMTPEAKIISRQQISEILLPIATDTDAEEGLRARCIMALGRLQDATQVELLANLLQVSSSKTIREACVAALSTIPNEQSLASIRRTLQDQNPDLRAFTIRTLLRLNDESSFALIIGLLQHDPDVMVRLTILELFPFSSPDNREVLRILPALLRDQSMMIRNEVINLFGRLQFQDSIPIMIAHFAIEKEAAVRQNIAYKLGQLFREAYRRDVEAILVKALEKDEADPVRVAAAISLGIIHAAGAEDKLIKGLENRNPEIRRAAAEALGNLRSGKAVKKLIKLVQDENAEVRRAAIISLGDIGDVKAIDPLLVCLNDENRYVRSTAEEALAKLKADPDRRELLDALNSSSPRMRIEAIRRLADTRASEVVPNLLAKLADDDYAVRQSAIDGLILFRDERSFAAISDAMGSDHFLIRQGVVTILGIFSSPRSIELLLQHLPDNNSSVRSELVRVLGGFDDDRVIAPLIASLNDYEPSVSDAAAVALVRQVFRLEKLNEWDKIATLKMNLEKGLSQKGYRNRSWDTWFKLFFLKNTSPDFRMTVSKGSSQKESVDREDDAFVFMNNEVVKFKVENNTDTDYQLLLIDLMDDGDIKRLSYSEKMERVAAHSAFEIVAVMTVHDERESSMEVFKVFASKEKVALPMQPAERDILGVLPGLQSALTAEVRIRVVRDMNQ